MYMYICIWGSKTFKFPNCPVDFRLNQSMEDPEFSNHLTAPWPPWPCRCVPPPLEVWQGSMKVLSRRFLWSKSLNKLVFLKSRTSKSLKGSKFLCRNPLVRVIPIVVFDQMPHGLCVAQQTHWRLCYAQGTGLVHVTGLPFLVISMDCSPDLWKDGMLDFRREFWKVAEGCWRLNISKKLNGSSRMIIKRKQLAAHLANPSRASTNWTVSTGSCHGPSMVRGLFLWGFKL